MDGGVWADFSSPDADAVLIRCWRPRALLLAVDKVILRDQQIMGKSDHSESWCDWRRKGADPVREQEMKLFFISYI
jgi:hypothetical protein